MKGDEDERGRERTEQKKEKKDEGRTEKRGAGAEGGKGKIMRERKRRDRVDRFPGMKSCSSVF